MLTLKYNSLEDKSPHHGQEVLVLSLERNPSSFGVKPISVIVKLLWIEYNDKGYETGVHYEYDTSTDSDYSIKDTIPSLYNYDYTLQLEWIGSSKYLYWIDSEEFTKSVLEGHLTSF